MDLSNYEAIKGLVRKLCKGLSPVDQEDIVQEVCLKLLVSGSAKANSTMLRSIIKQIKLDMHRKDERRPKLVFDNELVERYPGEGEDR